MRKILIITGRYLPGYRDGGPVRSIVNLTQWMGGEYDLRIMCLDRDHGDDRPYPDITAGEYNTVGSAKVWYTKAFTAEDIERLAADADVVYVCGPYGDYARIAMKLKKAGKITAPLFVASMGSFSPKAFKIKGFKKRLFIRYMKMAGLFEYVTWSVSSEREEKELKNVIGKDSVCVIATDLPRRGLTEHKRIKEEGLLKMCFISRISRKKNLTVIPDMIGKVDDDHAIRLDVYGTCEDADYLRECSQKLDELKKIRPGFEWEYKGEADSESVPEIFANYDAFMFPTLGENYGHVVAESLSAGCIPVISDTTPWMDLDENGCGYVCPLKDKAAFARAIDELYHMSEEQMADKRAKCTKYISAVNERSVAESGYRTIFG